MYVCVPWRQRHRRLAHVATAAFQPRAVRYRIRAPGPALHRAARCAGPVRACAPEVASEAAGMSSCLGLAASHQCGFDGDRPRTGLKGALHQWGGGEGVRCTSRARDTMMMMMMMMMMTTTMVVAVVTLRPVLSSHLQLHFSTRFRMRASSALDCSRRRIYWWQSPPQARSASLGGLVVMAIARMEAR